MSNSSEKPQQYIKDMEDRIQAPLQYLHPKSVGAQYHASQAGTAQEATHDGEYEARVVSIHNARMRTDWNLDQHGFQCVTQQEHRIPPSILEQIGSSQDTQILKDYEKSLERFLLEHIQGSKSIHIFDHTRRSSSSKTRQEEIMREPSSVIHNDYTAWSAKKRITEVLGCKTDTQSDTRRFAIVNIWRPTNGVVESWPMCFCDSTTFDAQSDAVSVPRVSRDGRKGEIQMVRYNSEQQWYFFPRMMPTEVLLFKTYDSLESVNQFTIHTAFDQAAAMGKLDAKPRSSMETRVIVIFE